MNVKEVLESQRLRIINSRRITLSGEINIMTSNIQESIIVNDDLFLKLNSYANSIKALYPYLKIETVRELHEITIKFFVYNKIFSDEKFLDNFQESLRNLLRNINRLNGLNVKLNICGEISTLSKMDKFRFINSGDEVYYKIIDTIFKNEFSRTVGKFIEKTFSKG